MLGTDARRDGELRLAGGGRHLPPRPLPTSQNSCMIGKDPIDLNNPEALAATGRGASPVVHITSSVGFGKSGCPALPGLCAPGGGQAEPVRSRRTLSAKRPNTRFPNPTERPS